MSVVEFKPPQVHENYPANLDAVMAWENIGRPLVEDFHPWNGWASLNVLVTGKNTDYVQDFLLEKEVPYDQITVANAGRDSSRPIDDAMHRSKQNIYDFSALKSEHLAPGSFDLVIAHNALSSLNRLHTHIAARNIASLMAGQGKGLFMLIEPNPAYHWSRLPLSARQLLAERRLGMYEGIFKKHGVVTPRGVNELAVHLPLEHPEFKPYDASKVKISPSLGALFFKPPKAENY